MGGLGAHAVVQRCGGIVSQWSGNPDYTLSWPAEIFEDELRRLIARAEEFADSNLDDEIETLFQQAFSSSTPLEDFRRAARAIPNRAPAGYDPSEEPF
jgi:hypothetical protein